MTRNSPHDDGREVLLEGAAAYQRGEVAEALRIFERAARTTTGGLRASALINAASMADELGDHATAIGWYHEALSEIPADAIEKRASALVNYSQALQHVGELDQAQSALEQARALLADNDEFGTLRVACLLSLCAVAFHRGRWHDTIEIATESLDAAVRFAPQLAGHPLMNLAGAYFETGHRELAVDFAAQALAAFESAQDRNGVAETQQNTATMMLRLNRLDEAEPLLQASQEYFERAGLGHRAGIGLKTMGFLAENRGDLDRAYDRYLRGYEYFQASGAVLDAADVQVRLATVAFQTGHMHEGQQLIAAAFHAYAERGLGLHCAQIDYWHATLLEAVLDTMDHPAPEILTAAANLAVTSAVAIDAVRHTFGNGNQREQWNRQIADPAMRMAFRFAYLSGDGPLLTDLIETQCAGTALNIAPSEVREPAQLPFALFDPPTDLLGAHSDGSETGEAGNDPTPSSRDVGPTRASTLDDRRDAADPADRLAEDNGVTDPGAESALDGTETPTLMAGTTPITADRRAGASALQLGAALAEVAASAGLPVAPPPRVSVGPDGHIALAAYVATAEQRYGLNVRDDRVVTA
ncbi:tetratricopeptide repeat protein [Nocardia aurea]|uniref:Tetratricopeptide repeat protein n=1 Tax=Nocardia aurea TaxID=2144174 RepID=A0ABV3G0H6_9NOCA